MINQDHDLYEFGANGQEGWLTTTSDAFLFILEHE